MTEEIKEHGYTFNVDDKEDIIELTILIED